MGTDINRTGDPDHGTVMGKRRRRRKAVALLSVDVFMSPVICTGKGIIK